MTFTNCFARSPIEYVTRTYPSYPDFVCGFFFYNNVAFFGLLFLSFFAKNYYDAAWARPYKVMLRLRVYVRVSGRA